MTATIIETSKETRLTPLHKVLLHNDDVNEMGHVMRALNETFKFEAEKCYEIMMEAHESGVALCKIEPLEVAELHQDQLQSFGLTATIEPE
jgi:ATP-dependent Clp protease adaptor protein ClpS